MTIINNENTHLEILKKISEVERYNYYRRPLLIEGVGRGSRVGGTQEIFVLDGTQKV